MEDIINIIKNKLNNMSSEEFYNYLIDSEVEVYKNENKGVINNG